MTPSRIIGGVIMLCALTTLVVYGMNFMYAPKNDVPALNSPDVLDEKARESLARFTGKVLNERDANALREAEQAEVPVDVQGEGKGEICTGERAYNFSCYEAALQNIVRDEGILDAFSYVKEHYNINPYIRSQCHPLVHVIGRAATLLYDDVSEAYAHGDTFCWSGFYHGVMEGIVGKIGIDALAANLNKVCTGVAEKGKYQFEHYNCVHGLGHGVMAVSSDELFEALDYCNVLADSWEEQSCAGGAFMENIIIDGKNHFTAYLKPDDPVYPCNAVREEYKNTCFLMQTSYMLKVAQYDFQKVFALCGDVEAKYVDVCYQSVGRDASGQSISDVDKTRTTCMLGADSRAQSNCIVGAAKDFVAFFHSDAEARKLCDSLVTLDLRSTCLATVNSYYQLF